MDLIANPQKVRPGGPLPVAAGLAVVVLLVAAVVAISAHAPTHIYAYAQPWNIGAAIGMLETGDWLGPRTQLGTVMRKPQLYAWLLAGALKLTGSYGEFVFRLPSVAASLALAVVVYVLSRRWFGSRVGLLAACLWVTLSHMHKLMYLATTDMLLALWIAVSVACADRLLLHPAPSGKRTRWVVGFWVAMILAGLTKGWGVVNFPVVGAVLALAVAVRPGFKILRRPPTGPAKAGLLVRVLLRRWLRAAKAVRLCWGALAFVLVIGSVVAAMLIKGGQEFGQTLHFELWQRITGTGPSPPASADAPKALYLFYYTLPASLFAVCALSLVRPRLWLARRSQICLPLCWILGVFVPFWPAHGFRPDYFLPCYPAIAMMGAWAIGEIARRGRKAGPWVSFLRHVVAAVPVVIGAALIITPLLYLLRPLLPELIRRGVSAPPRMDSVTWWGMVVCVGLGASILVVAVRASLRWRLPVVGWTAVAGMLGVLFVYTHAVSPHAAGEGEKMVDFARHVKPTIGDDSFAVLGAEKLCTQLFLGRFGQRITSSEDLLGTDARWLVTCDWGLSGLTGTGGRSDARGPEPADLGKVRWISPPIRTDRDYGRQYLIELRRDLSNPPRPR